MRPDVQPLIRRISVAAGALAVVSSPIPFADEVLLLPVYGWLALRVGRAHGVGPRDVPWRKLAEATAVGLLMRAAANAPFALVPGIDAAVNAVTAVALTQFLGDYYDEACAHPTAAARASFHGLATALRGACSR
jgi:uncharacterized protein (DUF697 family)